MRVAVSRKKILNANPITSSFSMCINCTKHKFNEELNLYMAKQNGKSTKRYAGYLEITTTIENEMVAVSILISSFEEANVWTQTLATVS